MKTINKSILCLFLTLAMLCGTFSMNAFAAEASSASILSKQEVSDYQEVLNKLNEEYGYSMYFAPQLFTRNNTFENPTKTSLLEFEASLRKEIEEDIAINAESKEAIAKLGNVKWESAPFEGKTYTIPANVSIYSSAIINEIYEDTEPYINQSYETDKAEESRSSDKTLTSVQPKLDPTGQVIFMLNTTISIPNYWKYTSVSGYNYGIFQGATFPIYIPTGMSYSYADSARTVAANFTCTRYNESGVIISNNTSVYREFHATSDCLTNSPNYSIPKTYTNKTYNHISGDDYGQNCAGYAWNHRVFVNTAALGITDAEVNNCSNLTALRTLVKNKSEAYMSTHGINATEISSYNSSINPATQYRVVMRVGYYDTNGNGRWDLSVYPTGDDWDYHWWMQLGDGTWADKRGYLPSRIVPNSNIYSDPDNILWTTWFYGEVNHNDFYNSTPVYYKITG